MYITFKNELTWLNPHFIEIVVVSAEDLALLKHALYHPISNQQGS